MSWADKLSSPYRVNNGNKFRLKDFDPSETRFANRGQAAEMLKKGVQEMTKLQDRLYADGTWGVLLIFQAMDAAGKDGAIKHVMSGINPQGCQVYSFKQPSAEELGHDYLWRTSQRIPERGRIGIFNRSYYEEVLVVRVHRELLEREKVPAPLINKNLWEERFEDICCFERYLSRNGILVRKFFLNLSKKEQKRRFLARLDDPDKNWKFSTADLHERGCWDDYMKAYEKMIQATSSKHAPWYVVPADDKWYARSVVSAAIVETLNGLNLKYPVVSPEKKKDLEKARADLTKQSTKASAASK
jgi:PPK2 family polyphosphate:nucleotide phosphotransferase